jgi:hypothetical protein
MRVSVCRSLLLFSLFASLLHAEPFLVSHPARIGVAPFSKYGAKAAMNDAGVRLVAWSDSRPGDAVTTYNYRSIRGALFEPVLRPVVDFGIAAVAAPGYGWPSRKYESDVEVASAGRDFLVAYSVYSAPGPAMEKNTHFAIVTSDGEVEAAPEVIPGALVSMTSALGHYFVVTLEPQRDTVQLTILNRIGRIVRSDLLITPRQKPGARLATLHPLRDGRLLVLWNGERSQTLNAAIVHPYLFFQRDYDGLSGTVRIGSLEASVGVAEGADRLLIAGRNTADEQTLTSAAVDRNGVLMFREDYSNYGNQWIGQLALQPAPAPDGFMALADEVLGSSRFLRFSPEGRRVGVFQSWLGSYVDQVAPFPGEDGVPVFLISRSYPPAVELAGIGSGVSWTFEVARSLPAQTDAAAAQCRGITTIAWRELSGDASLVRFRRFDAAGKPLGPANGAVTVPAGEQSLPAVTCGRRTTLVSWTERPWKESEQLRGRLLSDSGESLDPGMLARGYDSKVAFDGAAYVVLSQRLDVRDAPPVLTRWAEDGGWLDVRAIPQLAGRVELISGLAANGESLLMTWLEGAQGKSRLYAQPIARSLAPIGPPVALTEVFSEAQHQIRRLTVTASPDGWLAGWNVRGEDGWTVFTVRLGRDGSLHDPLGGVPTTPPSLEPEALQLGWDGTGYEVLTDSALVTRGLDGAITLRAAAGPGERLAAFTTGPDDLLVFTRIEPEHAVRLLYAKPLR